MSHLLRIFLLGTFLLVMVVGCSNSRQRLYVLAPLEDTQSYETTASSENLTIGLGPIGVPDYLDRPQIVTRLSRNQLELAELDKWALPLKENISDVLAQNLSYLIPTDQVIPHPWGRSVTLDYQVTVNIIRFEATTDGRSELIAWWQVLGSDGKTVLMHKQSSFSETTKGTQHAAKVSAKNRALENLSREIAEGIKTLAENDK